MPGLRVLQRERDGGAAGVRTLAGVEADRVRARLRRGFVAPANEVVVRIEPQGAQTQLGVGAVLIDVVGAPVPGRAVRAGRPGRSIAWLLRTEPGPDHPVRPVVLVFLVRRRHRKRDGKHVATAGEAQVPGGHRLLPVRFAPTDDTSFAGWRLATAGRNPVLSVLEVAHRLRDAVDHAGSQSPGRLRRVRDHAGNQFPGRLRRVREAPSGRCGGLAAARAPAGSLVDGRRRRVDPLAALEQIDYAPAVVGLHETQVVGAQRIVGVTRTGLRR